MQFRNDINGLRAIAVMPVLFFHSHLKGFDGGFLGVDVFFVISGYLITTLILEKVEEKKFSIFSFWNKRIRRIFPALILVVTITTIISFFTMLPYDLKNYGQSVVATLLSANNILLYLTSGYWSIAAEFKPLYHTWSLGVEDQYYLFIPLLIIIVYKNKKFNNLLGIILVLFAGSFLLSLTSANKELNFLMISHRMWELLAGSMVAIFLNKHKIASDNLKASIGLFMILFSFVFPYIISKNQAIYTLFPVLGTVLIILYSSNTSYIGQLLSIKPLSFLGTISYSIYLFHMPILVFLRLYTEGEVEVYIQTLFVLLSIPLAYLSWKYVENVFRDVNIVSNKKFYSIFIPIFSILISTGIILHFTYGLQSYSKYNYGINPQKYCDEPYKYSKSTFTTNKPHLLIIGDSFARDFINMLRNNIKMDKIEIVLLTSVEDNISKTKKLLKQADYVIAVSSAGMDNVINKETVTNDSTKLFKLLQSNTKGEFYLIGTKNFGFNNNFLIHKEFQKIPQYRVKVNNSSLTANKIEKSIWGKHYIDFISLLIDKEGKVSVFTPNGDFISFDTEHATKQGAKYLGSILLNQTPLKKIFDKYR